MEQETLVAQRAIDSAEKAEIQFLDVDEVHFMDDNPNVMADDRYLAMLKGMKEAGPDQGPYTIDPIHCYRNHDKEDRLEVFNGNHRLKAAQELKWPRVRGIIDPSIHDEVRARILSHIKNYERGDIDPWAQAALCEQLQKQGKTQTKVAEELHITKDLVKRRLALRKVHPDVVKALSVIPGFGPGHFEQLASLDEGPQKLAAKAILERNEEGRGKSLHYTLPNTDEVKRVAERAENEFEAAKALQNSLALYPDHKRCPKCKKEPVRISGLQKGIWVNCESYHTWNLKTGKLMYEDEVKPAKGKKKSKEKKLPQYVRTTRSIQDYIHLFSNIAKSYFPSLADFESLNLDAKLGAGGSVFIQLENRGHLYFSVSTRGAKDDDFDHERLSYTIEEKEYKGKLAEFKTMVRAYKGVTEKEAAKIEQQLSELFERYNGGDPKKKTGIVSTERV